MSHLTCGYQFVHMYKDWLKCLKLFHCLLHNMLSITMIVVCCLLTVCSDRCVLSVDWLAGWLTDLMFVYRCGMPLCTRTRATGLQ